MSHRSPALMGELIGKCDLTETCFLVNAIIQKNSIVRVGPFPIISGVMIVKSGEKFRLVPDYNLTNIIGSLVMIRTQRLLGHFTLEQVGYR